ncbi:short-chain dehydrogenase [Seiridium cupressi]
MEMASKFNVTPEKQASVPRFFWHQITFKPVEIRDVNLQGKTAIVTGSNTGVGFETSRQLLDLGISKLILAVRNEEKGKAASEKLSFGRDSQTTTIEVWKLDLSSYDSVIAFAEKANSLGHVDLAVLNAGIAPVNRVFNANTGHDEVVQVNYLSTALLAILLLPAVKGKGPDHKTPGRIIVVSSEVAAWTKNKQIEATPILAELDKPGKVDMVDRMMVSKLLDQFFVNKISKLVPPSAVTINTVSPAICWDTEFNRDHAGTVAGFIVRNVQRLIGNSSAVGARMVTDAAVKHGEETHGEFLSFQRLVPLASIIYTPEGERISEQLWKETLAEFAFANVERILQDIQT